MDAKKVVITPQKAVIKKGERYLILLRSEGGAAFPGLWDFAGGKLKPGEDPLLGLVREVKEETGLDVKPKEVIFTFDYERTEDTVHFVIYDVTLLSGDPEHVTLSGEHSEFRLATREEILKLPTMPYMKDFLNQTNS